MSRAVTAVLAVLALAFVAAGCGDDDGGSVAKDPAAARAAICTARADITRRVAVLGDVRPELASVPRVTREVAAITSDLTRVRAAAPGLDDADAAAVEADARGLLQQAREVTRATLSGGLAGDVRGALEPAIAQLVRGSRPAFSSLGC